MGFLKLNKLRLELKLPALDLSGRLSGLPLKDSDFYISDVSDDEEGKQKFYALNGNICDFIFPRDGHSLCNTNTFM